MGANAQTTVPTFVASQVLTADQQNQSARTGVPVFAGTTERDAAFGGAGEKTLAEGQLAYLESTNVVQYYDGAAWATVGPITSGVVQVKSTTKSDTFSFTTNSFVDVTGLSISITPTSASNKVFVVVSISIGSSVTSSALFKILRDSTDIAVGDAASSRTRTTGSTFSADGNVAYSVGATFLDSPATTSATTYKIQIRNANAANTGYVNRSVTDTDANGTVRTISTITVFEVTP